jgi:hypothetical protein
VDGPVWQVCFSDVLNVSRNGLRCPRIRALKSSSDFRSRVNSDLGGNAASQCRQVENPFAREHVFTEQKGPDGPVHPNDWNRPRDDEDRAGEPRLQHQETALLAAHRGGRIVNCLRQGALITASTAPVVHVRQNPAGNQSKPLNHAVWSR